MRRHAVAMTQPPDDKARPCLDLSGPALRHAFEAVVRGAEALGGIERYVAALRLKATVFADALGDGKAKRVERDTLMGLCAFMATVRRRVAPFFAEDRFPLLQDALAALLDGAKDSAKTDTRLAAFCAAFPQDKAHRWVRDLAAEILHNLDPERYPLMCRWVWDAKANTGVLREIWHGEDVDRHTLDVADDYMTFLTLREELSQFLTDNGVFRDVIFHVDLLCAQIYADYVCAQGGSYLRADFSSPEDPMQHVRRLLGLDGGKAKSARTRLKSIAGEAFVLGDIKLLG
ncbi:MAG: hypothetical protein ACOY99_04040 [Pseudomonadota bacterium]